MLAVMYVSRAVLIALYLLAPKTELTFYLFAAGLGFTWLATVPPTAAIVGKLFGVRYLATLFGLTLLSHQIGGFLGAYLGGLAIDAHRATTSGCGTPTWRSPPRPRSSTCRSAKRSPRRPEPSQHRELERRIEGVDAESQSEQVEFQPLDAARRKRKQAAEPKPACPLPLGAEPTRPLLM